MTMNQNLAINCDLGEGILDESALIPLIDVASVACGGHIGDANSIQKTLATCLLHGKKTGAHPSYPDIINFGRKSIQISDHDLIYSITTQLELFAEVAADLQAPIDHIKFHGALYNDAAANPHLADLLTDYLAIHFAGIPVFVPPQSEMERLATIKNLPIRLEIFGDRTYQNNYSLVSRTLAGSLLTQSEAVIQHLKPVFEQGNLISISGKSLPVSAQTICFHGDNPGLLEFLPLVRLRFWT